MKHPLSLLFCLALVGLSPALCQTNDELTARYQVILDRVPFGLVPPSKLGQAVLGFGRYAFVGLVSLDESSSNRVAVIHDRLNNRYYFNAEGEQVDDIKVLRIENTPTGRKLLLQRGSDITTLTYAQEVHQGGVQLNPFGPPPPVVIPGEMSVADKKAAARALAEEKKRESEKRDKNVSKREKDNSSRSQPKPQPSVRFRK